MSSILPKGIVVNTEEISENVDAEDGRPLSVEQISRMWKVYTTTHRRLLDPTAERLENYWWRIWGSHKMDLNWPVVAQLFAEISDGPTFVPLRGPSNRDESGGRLGTALLPGANVTRTIQPQTGHDTDSSSGHLSSNVSKDHSSMPPPILKKTRGPSTTGPRPTARFVSPDDSEEGSTESSPDPDGSHAIPRPSITDKKSEPALTSRNVSSDASTGPRKKGHVVAAACHKRKSGSTRRTTPQSTTNTSVTRGTQDMLAVAPRSEALRRSKEESSEYSNNSTRRQSSSKLHDNLSPSPEKKLKKAEIGSSKNSRSTKTKLSKSQSSNSSSTSTSELGDNKTQQLSPVEAGPSKEGRRDAEAPGNKIGKEELDEGELRELELQGALLLEANATLALSKHETQAYSGSSKGVQPPDEGRRSGARETAPQTARKSVEEQRSAGDSFFKDSITSSLALPSIASEGDWEDQPDSMQTEKGKEIPGESENEKYLFAKRPVQPALPVSSLLVNTSSRSNNAFGRSRSQLTLLVEEDRARTTNVQKSGGQPPPSK